MAKGFASTTDLAEKKISFDEVGPGLYAFTAEGDPNTGVIIGDESAMVIDAQATPVAARRVVELIRGVTDKPISHVVLSHYHAVRVLGASGFGAPNIVASTKCRAMINERGAEDWASEQQRFPRLFKNPETIPGLTWPNLTFDGAMTIYLGKRRVDLMHLGRAHTAGDIVAWVADSQVMFSGDDAEYKSACYCGDAHYGDWPATLDRMAAFDPVALVPGRGAALVSRAKVQEGLALTRQFLVDHFRPSVAIAARGGSLKEAFQATRDVCDAKYRDYAIYEHCLPFNVARAYDEALGIDTPRIWTAERDLAMWSALQG
ncbi:MAG: MBL fold metallo-hydrolase [Rhodospirillales bacterium]|nr:MBL fold metallo-hydrolase [Rhodospirillales bacterium]MDE2199486.1 MBL fold metallo-hydrolase [Rhodospirillales bacterium]MDE2575800.1 MBL fold metallo-hydrolase [Rhodospirillales bacterium]